MMIRVTIFNEFIHEKSEEAVKAIYPYGMHIALKEGLEDDDIQIKTVTTDDENCGITDEVLENTDVMLWWGHMGHHLVSDEIANKVKEAVLRGMGMVFLHSAHHSKPFKMLMGTSCNLSWRVDGDRELLWACNPAHHIAKGIDGVVHIEHEEVYADPFGIPEPDELVFIANFEGGEVLRAGCCYKRGNGNIFYFQPGHEEYPVYYNKDVLKVIKNAIYWAKPNCRIPELLCPHIKKPFED